MSVAYLFPGQGSQHVGMGVDVAASCPESADVYDRASAAVGYDLLAVCRSAADAVLRRTEISQPAVLATSLALLAAAPWLPRPSVVAGHSLGEYTALVATGAMNLEDAVGLVRHRGELMNRATRDRDVVMAAVLGLDKATVNDLCRRAEPAGCCQPAAYNAPTQTVVAGDRAAVQLLIEWAETAGARCSQLPVSSAFHTTLMAPIAADLHSYLANIAITDPQVPVISNVVAEGVQDAAHLRRLLISQLDQPVRWAETIAQLRVAGVDTVIAFGPGPVAGALCRANDRRLALSTIMDVHTLHTARARFVRSTRTPVPADERSTDEHDRLDRAVLAAAAHCPPDRPALVSVSTTVRFGELADRSGHCRAGLASAGIGTGDRVVVFLPNGPDLVIVLLALWQLGAIVVAALPAHRQRELAHLCDASGAVAIIVDGGGGRRSRLDTARRVRGSRLGLRNLFLVGSAGQAPGELQLPTGTGESVTGVMNTEGIPPVPGEPIALLLASGGSTGLPKLIPRTHLDYLHNVRISTAICRLDKHAVYLAALPALHNFTLGCPGILGTLLAGGTVVFAAHPDVATLHSSLRFHNATITALVPQLAVAVAAASAATEENLPTLRVLQVGGARVLPDAAREIQRHLPGRLQQVYGMAEGLLCFTRTDDPTDVVAVTQGRPASVADETRIVDLGGAPVRSGELGELWTRGPYTINGYYGASTNAFTEDGWYRTGDLARLHVSGNLVVEGRTKDVINRAGEKVPTAELETLIGQHASVAEVAAVGVPGPDGDETVCVVIVPRPGHDPVSLREIRRFLDAAQVARFKFPERLLLLDDLPRTAVGKMDKALLREQLGRTPVGVR